MNIRKSIRKWLGIPEPLTVEFINQVRELKEHIITFMEQEEAADKAYRENIDKVQMNPGPAVDFLSALSRHEDGTFLLNGSLTCTSSVSAHEGRNMETPNREAL